MKEKRIFLTFFLILLCGGAVCLFLSGNRTAEAVREDLSSHILRFHVLANSDSEEDQALKLSVKTAVLDYLEATLPEDADLGSTKAFLTSHEEEIRQTALEVIHEAGYDYGVSLSLEPWYFPTKTYGDLTFPCGTYEAFRIVIGEGEGKNWWCVLYPSLCFVDAAYSVVPEDSKTELRSILDEDTYETLEGERPQIRFKLFDWIRGLF